MRKLIAAISFVFLLWSMGLRSQTILIYQNVKQDTMENIEGPNRPVYNSSILGLEGFAGPSESDSVALDYFRSWGIYFGNRGKFKLSSFYNIGFESVFTFRSYSIEQNNRKIFATPQQHQRERLNIMQYSLQLFQRFNFTRRGDHLGTYLDMGGFGYWTFWRRHVTVDEVIVDGFKQKRRVVRSKLDYVNPLGYGVFARLGFNWFLLKAEYRMVSLFKDIPHLGYTDLPKFAVGISFDIPG